MHHMIPPGLINSHVGDPELLDRRFKDIIAAAKSLFVKKGYHGAGVEDIAQAAGISVGLLYRYVGSKEEILLLMMVDFMWGDEGIEQMLDKIESTGNPEEQVQAAIAAYCQAIDRTGSLVLVTYRNTAQLDQARRKFVFDLELSAHARIVKLIEAGIESGTFRPVDARVFAYNIIMVAHMWALKGWYLRSQFTLDEYIATQTDLFMHTLRND